VSRRVTETIFLSFPVGFSIVGRLLWLDPNALIATLAGAGFALMMDAPDFQSVAKCLGVTDRLA
jgi:hypothetical protein